MEQVLARCGSEDAYYWATHNGAELDQVIFRGSKASGVEFKVNDGPKMTKSLHIALEDLKLERAWIVHSGEKRYAVHEKIAALPIKELGTLGSVIGLR